MLHPTISVLLPAYNAAATLPTALDSLLAQTRTDFEILAVDDGSTDATSAVLAQYAQAEARIRVLRLGHSGIVAALNTGLAACQGQYIARMDSDDICHPRRLEHQAAFLEAHPHIGLVACRVDFPRHHGNAGYARYVQWSNQIQTAEQIQQHCFIESPFAHPSVLFRRDLVDTHGGYATGDFPEDYELWLRWLERGVRMHKLQTVCLTWNDPPHRLSRTDPRCRREAFYKIKAYYLARWSARHNPHHPTIVVWGAGRKTRQRAAWLTAQGLHITAYIDIDPAKIGHRIHGIPTWGPADIPPPGDCCILSFVETRGAREKIIAFLARHGYIWGRDFLPAA